MSIPNAPLCAKQSSQTERFEGSTPEGELSKSSPFQLEVPQKGTTPLITLAQAALAGKARSTITYDNVMRRASIAHLCASVLQDSQGFEDGVHDSNLVIFLPIQLEVPTTSGEQHTIKITAQSVSQTVTLVTSVLNDSFTSQLQVNILFSDEMSMFKPIWITPNHMITYNSSQPPLISELFNGGSTDSQVTSYSSDSATFLSDFASAMVKMGNLSPLTGSSGQIRSDRTRTK
ncbi:hypothetical protein AgCh_006303 [Apium graveolens]